MKDVEAELDAILEEQMAQELPNVPETVLPEVAETVEEPVEEPSEEIEPGMLPCIQSTDPFHFHPSSSSFPCRESNQSGKEGKAAKTSHGRTSCSIKTHIHHTLHT